MHRRIILLPEAEVDLREGYWWYENQDFGLGDEFLRCVEAAFSRISDNPLHYPVRFDDFRRILVRRFPFAIYFDFNEHSVFVHYVFHCSQHPRRLIDRLRP